MNTIPIFKILGVDVCHVVDNDNKHYILVQLTDDRIIKILRSCAEMALLCKTYNFQYSETVKECIINNTFKNK
jgi:hypothetical protein